MKQRHITSLKPPSGVEPTVLMSNPSDDVLRWVAQTTAGKQAAMEEANRPRKKNGR